MMTLANTAQESDRYFDFNRNVDVNATKVTKALSKAYNFVMWFFVRDSWIALLPRWCGTIMLVLTMLRLLRA